MIARLLPPLANLAAAAAASAFLFLAIGVPPLDAFASIARGAFGSAEGIGYTLFYATDYILAGLAVAIPYRAGLLNIGGEGQAMIGGLCVALACLALGGLPWYLVLPVAALAGMAGGAAWGFVPALMQARRGSNLVITTILFNFLSGALISWLLVGPLKAPDDPSPESVGFAPSTFLPQLGAGSPLNLALALALIAAGLAWLALGRTAWGYELRCVGESPAAARFAAIPVERAMLAAVCLGGACAGLIGVNEVMGAQHRLLLGFTAGAGFIGIAVALMARSHPLGLVLAAVLFGALSQGGGELALDMPRVSRDLVVAMNGLVILFCGALETAGRQRGWWPRLRPARAAP